MSIFVRRASIAVSAAIMSICGALATCGGQTDAPDPQVDSGIDASDGSPSDSNPNDADAGYDTGCPAGRGPTMVRVTSAPRSFCIDSTEVSQKQYAAFLADPNRPEAGQVFCASFDPVPGPSDAGFVSRDSGCAAKDFTPGTTPGRPVVCIDYCSAEAFCSWAGKHLCGGSFGVPPYFNEWQSACSSDLDAQPWPYGSTFVPGACNGPNAASTIAVGSLPTCQGSVPGLFDMSGNVAEWADRNCDNTGTGIARCAARGGSWASGKPTEVACSAVVRYEGSNFVLEFYERQTYVGFRCCSD